MDKITVNSNFATIKSNVESDITLLNSQKTEYDTATTDASAKVESLDFTGWEDSVSTKLQLSGEDLKSAITTIDSDVSGGSYSTLISKMTELYNKLDNCKKIKEYIEDKTDKLSKTQKYKTKTVDLDQRPSYQRLQSDGSYHHDYREVSTGELTEAYKNLQNKIKEKEKELETEVLNCNNIITYIEAIEFNAELSEDDSSETPGEEAPGDQGDQNDGIPLSAFVDDSLAEIPGLENGIEVTATIDGVTGTYLLKPVYSTDGGYTYGLYDPNNPSSILTPPEGVSLQELSDNYDARYTGDNVPESVQQAADTPQEQGESTGNHNTQYFFNENQNMFLTAGYTGAPLQVAQVDGEPIWIRQSAPDTYEILHGYDYEPISNTTYSTSDINNENSSQIIQQAIEEYANSQ